MATLSAALYLSGIPKDEFEEDLEDHYSMASNLLDSPNKLKEEWRCSTPLSHASTDSGYSRSLPDEPMTDVQVRIMENKAVVDFLKSVNTMADLKSAFTLLEVIDNIENRYYVSFLFKFSKLFDIIKSVLFQKTNLLNDFHGFLEDKMTQTLFSFFCACGVFLDLSRASQRVHYSI